MDVPASSGAEMRVGASIHKPLIIITVISTRKRSQIFGSEEPNLIAIRTKSYCPKNQILLPEDMAAFFVR